MEESLKRIYPLLLFIGLLLPSCDSGTSVTPTDVAWQLTSFRISDMQVPVLSPTSYTLRFNTDGTVNIKADCNLCNGGYQAQGSSLRMGTLACTRAFCPPPSFSDRYIAALSSATSFERRGGELMVTFPQGTMRFTIS